MGVDHLPSPPGTTPSVPLSPPLPGTTTTTTTTPALPPLPTPTTTPSPTPTPTAQPPATTNTAPGARPNVSALLAHLPPPALRKVASFVSALAAHLPPQHPDSEPARRVIQLAYWDMVNDYQLARARTCAAFRRGLAERDAVREAEKAAGWKVKRPTVMERLREWCPRTRCSSSKDAGNGKDADAASIDSASLLDEEDAYAGECARSRAIRRWCSGVRRACNTMCPDKDRKNKDKLAKEHELLQDDKTPHAHMEHLRIDSAPSPNAAAAAGGASPAGATGGSADAEADERADEPMPCNEDGYEHERDEHNDHEHHHDRDVVMSSEHHMARKRRHCDTDMAREAEGDMTKRMCTNTDHVDMADCPPTPPVSVPAPTPGGIDELKLVSALYACYVVNVATSVKHGVQRPRIVGLVKQMLAATSLRDMSTAVANAPAGGDRVPCPLQQQQQPGCSGIAAVPRVSNPMHANTQHNLAFNPHPITQIHPTVTTTINTTATTTTPHAHPVRQLPASSIPGVSTPAANPVVI